ncbi:DEGP8 [Symbiodinium sp. KB8]|nr:DEGP8 [Symbiodinium sp. KB8]
MDPRNYHVVRDLAPGELQIVFIDPVSKDETEMPKREILKGELVGSDPFTDTAVIKIVPPTAGTMTGNSGGPLLDAGGRVIGVNTAILTASGTSAGVGLAIPVDTVKRNVELILKQGFVSRGFLGITFAPDPIADALQIPGVIVYGIVRNSPAEAAGVRPMLNGTIGDVITSMDAKTIRTGADVFRLLDKRVPGDIVALGLQRARRDVDGNAIVDKLTLNVTLSSTPRKL